MAAAAQPVEQVTDLLQHLNVDSQFKAGRGSEASSNLDATTSDSSMEASASMVPADAACVTGAEVGGMETGMYYTGAGYAAPHGFYYGGYEFSLGEWDDYSEQMGVDGVEVQSPGVYGENGSVAYHTAGYSFAAQPMYGPYTPGTPFPAMGADGQLYGAQPYPYSGHLYQQPVPPAAQFMHSTSPIVEVPTSNTGDPINLGGESTNNALNANNVAVGPNPGYPVALIPSHGPYGPGILPINAPLPGSQDARVGFEGIRAASTWPDITRVTEGQQRYGISQPSPVPTLPGQTLRPGSPILTHIPAGQQFQPDPAAPGTLSRVYQPSPRMFSGSNTSGRVGEGLRANGFQSRGNGRNWIVLDKGKPRGQGNGMMCDGNGSLDILNEQNRGPRTTRTRDQQTAPGILRSARVQVVPNGSQEGPCVLVNKDQYNKHDFLTKYDTAKFFVIKSYSEDDVHKSIKYSVWASTSNGNKKLDAAFQDAQQKSGDCPIFLFFSVNASGQFCGVAEMIGPVDFNETMDFWQQDKWSGKFPVKWHIIKDVPNSQFRHIILENNDNKPITNSRDTQEVRLDRGLEMLKLFKNFIFKTSILDDFQFYENRQKIMQEKKARQHVYQQQQQGLAYRVISEYEPRTALEEAYGKSSEGKAGDQGEKFGKFGDQGENFGEAKDLDSSTSGSEPQACNVISQEEISAEKPLSRPSETRDSIQSLGGNTGNRLNTLAKGKETMKNSEDLSRKK